jgi:two-component system, LytTR family, response regulator
MNPLRVLIVDDEEDARVTLRSFLALYCPNTVLVGEASGVQSALLAVKQHKPDVVLLDIQMEDGTGFDFLQQSKRNFSVIFTTAYDNYAVKAFRFSAIDYLLKPIDPSELRPALEKAMESTIGVSARVDSLLKTQAEGRIESLTLSSSDGVNVVNLQDIVRLESDSNYTNFHLTTGKKLTVTKPMKEFESLLAPEGFFRIHQSHIIRLDRVRKVVKENGDRVYLNDGKALPLARRRREEFISALKATGTA